MEFGMSFENFVYRGEGRSNRVYSFLKDDFWYVLRVPKSYFGEEGSNIDVYSNYVYYEKFICPRFYYWYVPNVSLIKLALNAIPDNLACSANVVVNSDEGDWGIMMPDMCYIRENSYKSNYDVLTVELKPKQGCLSEELQSLSPYCENCLLQIMKHSSGRYSEMYDFCPMDIYSDNPTRMETALEALLLHPHNNLKIFKNGNLILSNDENSFHQNKLFCCKKANEVHSFVEIITKILLYQRKCGESWTSKNAENHDVTLLKQILNLQKKNKLSPFQLSNLVKEFDYMNTESWLRHLETMVTSQISEEGSAMLDAVVAATVRDCSVMMTFIVCDEMCNMPQCEDFQLDCGCWVIFRIALIDLDIKSPSKLVHYGSRLLEAIEYTEKNNYLSIRPPCTKSST
ncbi:Inositol-pentakisphosphate 2-kinase [Trichinella sp. T9]|nr:Inositol-pentakisphosphate 2-kinase [Trichinella sp. T9]